MPPAQSSVAIIGHRIGPPCDNPRIASMAWDIGWCSTKGRIHCGYWANGTNPVQKKMPSVHTSAIRLDKGRPRLRSAGRGVESGGRDERREGHSEDHRHHQPHQACDQALVEPETQRQSGTQDHHGGDENPNSLGSKARKQTRCTVYRQDP